MNLEATLFSAKQRLVVIIELFEKGAGGNRKAVIVGLDGKTLNDKGAMWALNTTVEAELGGVNGYPCVVTAEQAESVRFFLGDIVVEDGATGTTISLG